MPTLDLTTATSADLARRGAFALGPTRVDPAAREVAGPGGTVTIEPRVMQVLVALAHASGGVVTRDDLSRLCWNGQIVGDDALNRAVAEVRRVARGAAAGSFAVGTIPRSGYRLTGATQPVFEADRERDRGRAQGRLSRRLALGGGLVGLGAAAGLGGWALWSTDKRRRATLLAEQARVALADELPDGLSQGVALLRQALALTPADADLWGKLALALRLQAEFAPPSRSEAAVKACEEAASRAMVLAPRQPDARTALITLRAVYGDWLVVEKRLRAVLADAPDAIAATAELAALLQSVGRSSASLPLTQAVASHEPLSPIYQYRLAYQQWTAGRIGEADRTIDRAFALWPRHPGVWTARAWLMGFSGRAGLALAQIDDAEARPGAIPEAMISVMRLSIGAIDSRAPAAIQAAVTANLRASEKGPGPSANAIMILTGLGRLDEAFAVADAFLVRRGPRLMPLRAPANQAAATDQRRRHTQVLFVPVTAPLRADPRFLPLMEASGLAEYWRRSGHPPDFVKAA